MSRSLAAPNKCLSLLVLVVLAAPLLWVVIAVLHPGGDTPTRGERPASLEPVSAGTVRPPLDPVAVQLDARSADVVSLVRLL